jgi:hypothetical protein
VSCSGGVGGSSTRSVVPHGLVVASSKCIIREDSPGLRELLKLLYCVGRGRGRSCVWMVQFRKLRGERMDALS